MGAPPQLPRRPNSPAAPQRRDAEDRRGRTSTGVMAGLRRGTARGSGRPKDADGCSPLRWRSRCSGWWTTSGTLPWAAGASDRDRGRRDHCLPDGTLPGGRWFARASPSSGSSPSSTLTTSWTASTESPACRRSSPAVAGGSGADSRSPQVAALGLLLARERWVPASQLAARESLMGDAGSGYFGFLFAAVRR